MRIKQRKIFVNPFFELILEIMFKSSLIDIICAIVVKKPIKYGKFPPKEDKSIPWNKLGLYLIGTYKIHRKVDTTLQ